MCYNKWIDLQLSPPENKMVNLIRYNDGLILIPALLKSIIRKAIE